MVSTSFKSGFVPPGQSDLNLWTTSAGSLNGLHTACNTRATLCIAAATTLSNLPYPGSSETTSGCSAIRASPMASVPSSASSKLPVAKFQPLCCSHSAHRFQLKNDLRTPHENPMTSNSARSLQLLRGALLSFPTFSTARVTKDAALPNWQAVATTTTTTAVTTAALLAVLPVSYF